jgi:hypothetical protein
MINLNEIHYKVYLDDIRNPTQTYPATLNTQWTIARNYNEFVKVLNEKGLAEFYSFDADLADEHYNPDIPHSEYKEKTGYEALKYLVNYCMDRKITLPPCKVHSMNPVARENMNNYIRNYRENNE